MKLKTLPLLILPAVLAACGHGTEDFKKDDKGTDDKKPAVVESQKFIPASTAAITVAEGKDLVSVKLNPQGEKVTDPTKVLFSKTITVTMKEALTDGDEKNFGVYLNTVDDKVEGGEKIGDVKIVKDAKEGQFTPAADPVTTAAVLNIFKNSPEKVYLVVDSLQAGDQVTFATEAELK